MNMRYTSPNFRNVSIITSLNAQKDQINESCSICWWDPIIPTPGNLLSIDSFRQLSLFRHLPHPPSVHHAYHPKPHYTSVTHRNSETRYWSEAFTILNPTTILSCLSTGYSTVQYISSVWTFTYTSVLSDFPFSFTLFHVCIKVHVS